MKHIDRSKPVMVTGATGYIAGWLIKKLLEQGLTVHATVRDLSDNQKKQALLNLANGTAGELKLFQADLLDAGSYTEAMKNCELVFHTASPVTLKVKNNQRDLIDPALSGTRNVLDSVSLTESVKRVVLTSSCTAVYADQIEIEQIASGKFTEDNWNTTSNAQYQPYHYSKVIAEKAAWEIASKQHRWDLVVVLPSLALGAPATPYTNSQSFTFIKQMGDGSMKAGIPKFPIAAVDVRDVAEVHLQAGLNPKAQGRYIASACNTNFLDLAGILMPDFGDKYPIPKRGIPKALLWLVAPIVTRGALTRKMVNRNLGYSKSTLDNTKSIQELGITYQPVEDALRDMFSYMIEKHYFQ